MHTLPRFIALCGHPQSGKSLVQQILKDSYQVQPVDDGWCLRDFAMRHLGLTKEQVTTQAGKAEYVVILGRSWQVREILGVLGNHLESMFGADIFGHMASLSTRPDTSYSLGSVRRLQGHFYKSLGGVVVGIHNPQAPPSPYQFDKFDATAVDHWITNDALARGLPVEDALVDLKHKVDRLVWQILDERKQAA